MKVKLITPKKIIKLSIVHAIEGARFAKKSLGKSDSTWCFQRGILNMTIGEKDLELACKLANNHPACGHDKFLQSIPLLVDISWTRSMWQEFDTYRIGVSKQSESTMHTITQDEFSYNDFELDDNMVQDSYTNIIGREFIKRFLDLKDSVDADFKKGNLNETVYRETLRKILPECFIQKRRVSLNYAVLKTIYVQRKNHRNAEWIEFLEIMKDVTPYSELWIGKEK